jgi:hypothetical protein
MIAAQDVADTDLKAELEGFVEQRRYHPGKLFLCLS